MIYKCTRIEHSNPLCHQCWLYHGVEHTHHRIINNHHAYLESLYICYDDADESEPSLASQPKCPVYNENPEVTRVEWLDRAHQRSYDYEYDDPFDDEDDEGLEYIDDMEDYDYEDE